MSLYTYLDIYVCVVRVRGPTHLLPVMVLVCCTHQGCSLQICNLLPDSAPLNSIGKTKGLNLPRYICIRKDTANHSASTSFLSLSQVIALVIECCKSLNRSLKINIWRWASLCKYSKKKRGKRLTLWFWMQIWNRFRPTECSSSFFFQPQLKK